jgi:methylated-DNA-[protein]-cysteine S-methyltransferase
MTEPGRQWATFDTALGTFALVWSARGLVRVLLPERDAATLRARLARLHARPADGPAALAPLVTGLQAHAEGVETDYAGVVLDARGVGAFEMRVYTALRGVGWGATTTYGRLAALAGSPGAAREVGAALARNPWPVVAPCHRVLAAQGALGGFSAPGGTETKRRLLALEGVFAAGTPDLPGLFG